MGSVNVNWDNSVSGINSISGVNSISLQSVVCILILRTSECYMYYQTTQWTAYWSIHMTFTNQKSWSIIMMLKIHDCPAVPNSACTIRHYNFLASPADGNLFLRPINTYSRLTSQRQRHSPQMQELLQQLSLEREHCSQSQTSSPVQRISSIQSSSHRLFFWRALLLLHIPFSLPSTPEGGMERGRKEMRDREEREGRKGSVCEKKEEKKRERKNGVQ